MKIRIDDLRDGVNQWSKTIFPEDLELEHSQFPSEVNVSFQADKAGGKIKVDITTETDGSFLCDRCGQDSLKKLRGSNQITWVKRSVAFDNELPGDELRSYLPGQKDIELECEVRDSVLLSVPVRNLCAEDCRGLCPKCGANLNNESCRCQ